MFLSSPGDVAEERAIARDVLEQLPTDPLLRGSLTIEAVSWDDPAAPVPLSATLTPLEAIDRGLPSPAGCDLTIVVLWGRMGTPLSKPRKPDGSQYLSGTEYEFENARAADKPVFVYRRTGSIPVALDDPELDDKRKQKALVDRFFEGFSALDGSLVSGYHTYENLTAFRQQFEAHAKAFVRQLLPFETVTQPEAKPASVGPPAAIVPESYRLWLQDRCGGVELLGLRLRHGQSVRLKNVYVPLTTTRSFGRKTERTSFGEDTPSDQLLLTRIGLSSAYVSGDPGSGKSTFCRWLAWLACEGVAPPADIEPPDHYREHLGRRLRHRLPLLVPLREFWRRLSEHSSNRRPSRRDIESAIGTWLEQQGAIGIDGALVSAHADQGTALFLFDGIDEVPAAHRVSLIEGLTDARGEWMGRGNRIVVTSRPYGLTDSDVRRLGLPQVPIRPLPKSLQWLLIRRWFSILSETADRAHENAKKMAREIREQAWAGPLTQNPLLLTGMCIVFGDGKRLPEDKYELYDRVADAVLHNRIPDRQRLQLIRGRLAMVALGMHTGEGLSETRQTPQPEVTNNEIDRLLRWYQDRSIWTESHVQAISDSREELITQTGLLLPRGEHHAAFLHLSFQEFLAAQRLADVDADRIRTVFVERSHAAEWRNTLSFLYGALLYLSTTPDRAVRLLLDLLNTLKDDDTGLILTVTDAAQILVRRGIRLPPNVEDELRQSCLAVMHGRASARDRASVGAALGRIGDPRFDARRWYLPDDELLGFVEIEGGSFAMGSDLRRDKRAYGNERPQHEGTLPAYLIGRWPVTVAQFRAFVEDSANSDAASRKPESVKGIANHPVTNVSWHEALAYCQWLNGKLRASPDATERLDASWRNTRAWSVTLPSEAEWEKAARGIDARVYPWGSSADSNRANCRESGIGSTSAVGCFPGGRSPYEVEDLVGNVWEWTRTPWFETYFGSARGTDRDSIDDESSAAVRGGSFGDAAEDARAACRAGATQDYGWWVIGFRVAITSLARES